MLKKNNGVTLSILVITVVIMMIITGISFMTGTYTIKQIRAGRIISNMKLIKSKVETIAEQNNFDGSNLIGEGPKKLSDIVEISEEEKGELAKASGETTEMIDNWDWYKWNKTTLINQGLDSSMLPSSNEEYFYVNYSHGEVLYTVGTSFDNSIYYYTLTGVEYILTND